MCVTLVASGLIAQRLHYNVNCTDNGPGRWQQNICTARIIYWPPAPHVNRLCRRNNGSLCFAKNNMQYQSTSAFISYCQKRIFRFEWATEGLSYYLKGKTLIQSDRCQRKIREVMKDSLSVDIKTFSWDFVCVPCLLSGAIVFTHRPGLSAPLIIFSSHSGGPVRHSA